MRILTISNLSKQIQVADLALKCRRTGEKWIDLISQSIQTTSTSAFAEIEKLRLKIVNIGISCVLSFSTHQDRIHCLMSSNEHVISLLKATTTVHDNIILNTNQSSMSNFMRTMMRVSERVVVMVQRTVAKFLQGTFYKSLNEFAAIYWAVIKQMGKLNGKWKKRIEDDYDGWYDCQYGTNRWISLDCIGGTFLVDGISVGFLPEKITSNELFIRVFSDHIFEVQAAEIPNTYISKHAYHDDGKVHYEFHFNDQTKHLTINERDIQTKETFQLIPHQCFQTELPDAFISQHSHWLNTNNRTLEFRSVTFETDNFLHNKPYILSLDTESITTTDTINKQVLINQSSEFFQRLFNWYFIRLDDKPYVYMMQENTSLEGTIVHIHLSRLGIAFKYSASSNTITSREYSDMCIEKQQWFGTLTGLKSGLLLTPLLVKNQRIENYPYRKLIVPFGEIYCANSLNTEHQTVTIRRSSTTSTLQQYFVFILNDRLKILQSTDSPTGWLYLALLHGMTSHPLPDEYTGMTGMERAFQLLSSAGCWSDQPFDALSLQILGQIAAISPKADYYPRHLTAMEKIDWNTNGIPYSMQHFGYYLIAKRLIKASEQLTFMYPSSTLYEIPKIFQEKTYNEELLKKLYWKHRDSYNPLVRLPVEIEESIECHSKPYQSSSEYCSHITNYSTVHLVNDLYRDGEINLIDRSTHHWLPLSQWLSDDNKLKNVWIGLLKLTDRLKVEAAGNTTDDIQRFEVLLDFLHYVSGKCGIKPFYLQMLKTAFHMPDILSRSITFPPFISYSNIEQISFEKEHLNMLWSYDSDQKDTIEAEVQSCFRRDSNYENRNKLLTSSEITRINQLLTKWQNNRTLRTFLESIQNRIFSVPLRQFNTKVSYCPQQFAVELIECHHTIQLKLANTRIDQTILSNAERKFHHPYVDCFNKSSASRQTIDEKNAFPQEIFTSTVNEDNPLSEIANYFENQLSQSWKKLLSDQEMPRKCPSIQEVTKVLDTIRDESVDNWNELVKSITGDNKQLFQAGLASRITPTTLISCLKQSLHLTSDQRTLLGGTLVNWTLEQQLERALHFAVHDKMEDFIKEISNTPHSNWTPSEYISWLILELEMNITIREIQVKVARHMMHPHITGDTDAVKSLVMQMNMGEGKTSVILPMLAVSLSSSQSSLVRIVLLKSLLPTNYQSLRCKLGGLLNQQIFSFTCRRDMNLNEEQMKQMSNRFEQGLRNCDVMLTSPEDILSFDLLTIDKCRRNEFDIGRSMLTLQRWMKKYVRDILDESDEILHVKYQLIYTVGEQQQLDAGAERWKTIQSVLELVKKHAIDIFRDFKDEICYKPSEQKSAFPQFRLQSSAPFSSLCEKIAHDWLENKSYLHTDKQSILSFILKINSSIDDVINQFPHNDIQLFLIVRGLLSSEVLLIALKKRYRVNYGVNPNDSFFKRLMAVPFRAKDVVADRTEFGHPDVTLVLTQLSYYYSGLNDQQITQCLNRLTEEETNPASIYDQWILYEDNVDIPQSIQQWKGVNIKDYHQRTCYLFPTFQYNMRVINYFLNHFVYPREAKQFPRKLVSSAWDLSSSARTKIITGFSGTNDTQLLLPVHIRQCDLSELEKTDAIVVHNLLRPENNHHESLPINASSVDILNRIVKYDKSINVILDVGALFIDGTNEDIAMKWLTLSDKNKIDYVVYFASDSIVVCDRQGHPHRFETSPASERLDLCIFYLDEIHTRGTDFKFPKGFRAAVTLGNGLTKDRFVQAAMRMRKLGNGHSLTFWSSNEVHQQIRELKKRSSDKKQKRSDVNLHDILRWVYENTVQATWDGLHHWAAQSLSYQRKYAAFRNIHWNDHEQLFTDPMMKQLAEESWEPEIIELKSMYGAEKVLQTVFEIHSNRYEQVNHHFSTQFQNEVLNRLKDYEGKKLRLSQLLDEEQQRELEQELQEERQVARPPPVKPCQPKLNEEIKRLCDADGPMLKLDRFPNVFRPLPYAFNETTLFDGCQADRWQPNLWISTEFQRVIMTTGESLDPFLRPPRWLIVYRNEHLIFLSAYEANWLIGRLQSGKSNKTTLRLLLPRIKRFQSIFVNTPELTIPASITPSREGNAYTIPLESLVQLFIFNGTLYFDSGDEQTEYCQCLSLCPKPWTKTEEKAFECNLISADGFVGKQIHRRYLQIHDARFLSNPLTFVKQLLENRNNAHATIMSHVGSIIFNSLKLV